MSLPAVELGGRKVSRLIIGGNPISGNSHLSPDLDGAMTGFFTMERTLEVLRRCEEVGINTFQARADGWILHIIREHVDSGGGLQFILQTASELKDIPANIRGAAAAGAFAVYHHGTETDRLWREGRIDEVPETLKVIRDCGAAVGLGTHVPEVIEHAEERGWDLDFYMACLYNLGRGPRESFLVSGQRAHEDFEPADPPRMCRTIRQAGKPCLAFKLLAAGRNCRSGRDVRAAFRFAFENIKPADAVVVGMFPRDSDQVAENAALVREFG